MIIPKINFPLYGIIIAISMIIGMLYVYISLRKDNYKDKNILLYFIMYIAFSIVFGKMFTMLTTLDGRDFLSVGLSSYGGVVGVILSAYIFEKILPTNNKIMKYSIISLPLIYGLSKIACFIVGCCYGIPYNGPLSVTYSNGLNEPLFPIQITETIVFLIVFLVSHKLRNNNKIIYIVIILSVICKFLLDFLRYDHLEKIITINQIFSIILLIVTIIIYIYNKKHNK